MRLAIAHPFTARELAQMVRTVITIPSITAGFSGLAEHLSPEALQLRLHNFGFSKAVPISLSTHLLVRDALEQHSTILSQSRIPRSICS